MADSKRSEIGATQPIERPSKVHTDQRGRTVWSGAPGTGKFELVSTEVLQSILDSGDEDARNVFKEVAKTGDPGVLARNNETGKFQLLDPDVLDALAEGDGEADAKLGFAGAEAEEPLKDFHEDVEFELVSTQKLQLMLAKDDPNTDDSILDLLEEGEDSGSDPYNSS